MITKKNNTSFIYIPQLLLFFLFCNSALAQNNDDTTYAIKKPKTRIGIYLGNYITGNGLGSYYNPGISLKHNAHLFRLGPSLQKQGQKFNGLRFTYSYSVTGIKPDEQNINTELNFFISGEYYVNAPLSEATIAAEGKIDEYRYNQYKSLRLTSTELYGGIGLTKNLFDNFCVRFFIGLGYYRHQNLNLIMNLDASAVVLMTGIGFGIFK